MQPRSLGDRWHRLLSPRVRPGPLSRPHPARGRHGGALRPRGPAPGAGLSAPCGGGGGQQRRMRDFQVPADRTARGDDGEVLPQLPQCELREPRVLLRHRLHARVHYSRVRLLPPSRGVIRQARAPGGCHFLRPPRPSSPRHRRCRRLLPRPLPRAVRSDLVGLARGPRQARPPPPPRLPRLQGRLGPPCPPPPPGRQLLLHRRRSARARRLRMEGRDHVVSAGPLLGSELLPVGHAAGEAGRGILRACRILHGRPPGPQLCAEAPSSGPEPLHPQCASRAGDE
mmetsp:Transcript_12296/g.28390  ORF Transcript_12296/g.28390 Transcript_12296/m.28390 type:complete len:284 (+) Transcript_12296:3168-4019(+)